MTRAINDLEGLRAQVVDPFEIPEFGSLRRGQWCADFKADIEGYLATFVKRDSLKTLDDLLAAGESTTFARRRMEHFLENQGRREGDLPCGDPFNDPKRIAFRAAIENEMDRLQIDAIIYPSWNYPPARIERFEEDYKGDNSQIIAPHTGQPAFTIPMGYTSGNLPAGLQFLGRMFDEPTLIEITYGYEQGTKHRKPPRGLLK